mmetsp:Transcript_9933/g.24282  ORF Transcript_9933/g.24282 Transcript_9933/m.24282 type:complete len:209 (+) Transcript_9933:961-1587(+)
MGSAEEYPAGPAPANGHESGREPGASPLRPRQAPRVERGSAGGSSSAQEVSRFHGPRQGVPNQGSESRTAVLVLVAVLVDVHAREAVVQIIIGVRRVVVGDDTHNNNNIIGPTTTTTITKSQRTPPPPPDHPRPSLPVPPWSHPTSRPSPSVPRNPPSSCRSPLPTSREIPPKTTADTAGNPPNPNASTPVHPGRTTSVPGEGRVIRG